WGRPTGQDGHERIRGTAAARPRPQPPAYGHPGLVRAADSSMSVLVSPGCKCPTGRLGRQMPNQSAVAEHPHPVVAQLAALHHFRVYADIAVVVVVLALTNLIAHFTTPWASFATVP